MNFEKTPLEGLLVIHPVQHEDSRGFFSEVVRYDELAQITETPVNFVRELHSHSYKNVLRGLHAEPWQKLFYITQGQVFSAIADIRPDSKTFGKVRTGILDNKSALYIPPGFANGFCVISESADLIYLVSGHYDPKEEKSAIAWDDPDLGIHWPSTNPILSEPDKRNPCLRKAFPEKFP